MADWWCPSVRACPLAQAAATVVGFVVVSGYVATALKPAECLSQTAAQWVIRTEF
jgi:hypothetical protein